MLKTCKILIITKNMVKALKNILKFKIRLSDLSDFMDVA